MNRFNAEALIAQVRSSWLDFHEQAFAAQANSTGLAIALTQTFPDGWQMVVDLLPVAPNKLKLSDGGRTLGWLSARGQNVETDGLESQVRAICRQTSMEREGWELFRWVDNPPQGVDLHIFAEGLSNVAHLHYLHDPTPRGVDSADRTLRRVFSDRKLTVFENHPLDGKTERSVRVDFFLPATKPVAFQLLHRRGRVQATMEQWGYRWQDLRKRHPSLKPAMVYDPAVQLIDEAAKAIGEEVCDLFCSYEDTDKIHALIQSAQNLP
jgi:hypothetical protein